jgi:EmrB/QacA subfamily drug resistance transporter
MTERIRLLQMNDGNRRWWALGAMCFALFMIMLDNTVVNVALPSIQRSLHASTASLEWTVNAYTLSFAVLLVTGGRLGDLFGRRRMFLAGVVVFALSSGAIGFSPNDTWLVVWRAIQGTGSAMMMPGTLSIITNAFPAEERGKAIGTWAGVSALALAIGPVLGGFLVQSVSWQSIFFLNLPVAVGAVLVTLFAVRESRDESASQRVDGWGVLTLTSGLAALVLALVEGNEWHWGSTRELALFAFAALTLGAFAAVERRQPSPMVDFSFFRSRTFLGANIVAFIVSFAMLAMFFFMALYMQNVLHFTPLQAGVRFLPSTLMIVVIAPLAGRLADRVGPRPLMTFGLTAVAGALFWQSHLTVSSGYGALLPGFVLMGIGMAFVMSPMSTAAMNAVEQTKAGVASGILSMNRMVGGTFGVAVLGAMVATLGRSRIDQLLPALPAGARAQLAAGLGSGAAPHGVSPQIVEAGRSAFVYALHYGLLLGSGVALLGALTAWATIGRRTSAVSGARAVSTAGELIARDARASELDAPAPAPAAVADSVHA